MTAHSFHIPVMGIAFTIDTPLKVAHFGIDSTISLVDDILLEKMRKMYCERFEIPYQEITENSIDFRAKRISSYLNLIKDLAEKKFEQLKDVTHGLSDGLKQYFDMLPNTSSLKKKFENVSLGIHNPKLSKNFLDSTILVLSKHFSFRRLFRVVISVFETFRLVIQHRLHLFL